MKAGPFKGFKTDIMSTTLYICFIVIGFSLSWLVGNIKSHQIILYTLGTIILISIFQSLLAWFTINTAKDKKLEEQIDKIHQTTEDLLLSRELLFKGTIISTERFMELESQMKEVWVVLEDMAVFDKNDGGFYKFNIEDAKKGTNYVYFTSSGCSASVKTYISRITGKRLSREEPIPEKIGMGKGKIEFVFVDPKAFLFVSPITIWNPYHDIDEERKRKVLLDFPKYPAGYHLVVEDDSAERIFNRLEELYEKSECLS